MVVSPMSSELGKACCRVEHVFHIDHRLPTVPIGDDKRQVNVAMAKKLIAGLVVEDAHKQSVYQ